MLAPWLEAPLNEFAAALREGRLPGSVIIAGAPGLGLDELALECARLYLCQNRGSGGACGNCPSCAALARNGSHPDFLAVLNSTRGETDEGRDTTHVFAQVQENFSLTESAGTAGGTRTVRIDSVRQLPDFLLSGTVFGSGKVALIPHANLMRVQAANAVLKTFEEPPPNCLILMTTPALTALLPTILSRAFKITVKIPDAGTARNWLSGRRSEDPARIALALDLAGNSPGRAGAILDQGLDERARELVGRLASFISAVRQDPQGPAALQARDGVLQILAALEGMEAGGRLKVGILEEILREILLYKATSTTALPLYEAQAFAVLARIKADTLFAADFDLKNLQNVPGGMAPRAPDALGGAWLQRLCAP